MDQKERARRHYLKDRDKYLERAARQRKYEKEKLSPELLIFRRIKASAKARGLEFALSVEDIKLPKRCPYLDCELAFNEGGPRDNSYSVDRIDNTKGYVKDNIEVISFRANAMKQNTSIEDQLKFAREVLRRYEIS